MFDYTYGTPTKKFKQEIEKMKPRLPLRSQPECKTLVLVLRFLHGLEVNIMSEVSKLWYSASWTPVLWQSLAEAIGEKGRINALCELADSKLRTFERRSAKQDLSDLMPNTEVRDSLRWKLVYGQLLYSTCSHCKIAENKLRFLPILQKALCYNCAKLPNFTMISLEDAEIEYGVSRKHVNDHQLEGLRVPDPGDSGKFIFVYYMNDILRLKRITEVKKKEDKGKNTELHEKRRFELISCMKKEGIEDRFISICMESEGSLAYNYILGKSRMPAAKIAKKMLSKYDKWKESDEEEDEALPEPEIIMPLKRPKIELTTEDKVRRRVELIERLLVMGVSSDDIGLEDPESIANAYIEGRTREDLGPVAGSIWREKKPVFTGVPFRNINNEKSEDEIDDE